MSWFSAAFTRAKSVISAGVSLVPVVGGIASRAIDGIHTGDEHMDANGVWVNNSTGAPSIEAPNAALQAEVDRVNEFNRQEALRRSQAAADTIARVGTGAALTAANAVGPPGNVYGKVLGLEPWMLALAGVAVVGGLFLVMRGGRR